MSRGDHYEVTRAGFRHHGIDIGDGSVVHFTGEPFRKLQASVLRTAWADFARGDAYRLVDYEGWTFTPDHTCLRALSLVGLTGYDLARNNCEHFATFCKVGVKNSLQVNQSVTRIAKYSKFAARSPGMIFAGPAIELGRRLAGATAYAVHRATSAPSVAPTPTSSGFLTLFHYVDTYAQSDGEMVVANGYDQWYRISDGSPLHALDDSAALIGTVMVDDQLTPYMFQAGGIFRFRPDDKDVRYAGAFYLGPAGKVYFTDEAGTCREYRVGGSGVTQPLPDGSELRGFLFREPNGVDHLRTPTGWRVHQGGDWIEEPDFRLNLAFIT